MKKFIEILDFVNNNENSAFFYSPNIYKNSKSYVFGSPEKILEFEGKTTLFEFLDYVDSLLAEKKFFAIGLLPYETGYLLQGKKTEKKFKFNIDEMKLRFLFYNPENVKIVNSDEIDFGDTEKLINKTIGFYEKPHLNFSKNEYVKAIRKIKNHIAEGDCYQINFTTKLKFELDKKNLTAIFAKAVFNQSSAYSAFIHTKENLYLSFSPELFFETNFDSIKSKPMKGTVKRGISTDEDEIIKQKLLSDKKNLAENVMIVDLLRNDIGKISEINSVNVPRLFEVEKYETLFQLTSTVEGKLIKNKLGEIIKNLFPCGSITGAPKLKTMEIINELEKEPRGIYTGSIGLITDKKAVFNIAIRTVTFDKKTKKAELGLGSGVVWDSNPESEFEEVLLKGNFLLKETNYFELLETILYENGNYFLLDKHLERLKKSANYFMFKYNEKELIKTLQNYSLKLSVSEKYKVRLTLSKWGKINITEEKLEENFNSGKALLTLRGKLTDLKFAYHKTTCRPWQKKYVAAREKGFTETIFFDEKGNLLEGAVSNIFIVKENILYTPPATLPILPGCYRNLLIEKENAKEKNLTIDDLKNADEVFLCNSVRKKTYINEIFDETLNRIFVRKKLN